MSCLADEGDLLIDKTCQGGTNGEMISVITHGMNVNDAVNIIQNMVHQHVFLAG